MMNKTREQMLLPDTELDAIAGGGNNGNDLIVVNDNDGNDLIESNVDFYHREYYETR